MLEPQTPVSEISSPRFPLADFPQGLRKQKIGRGTVLLKQVDTYLYIPPYLGVKDKADVIRQIGPRLVLIDAQNSSQCLSQQHKQHILFSLLTFIIHFLHLTALC